MTELGARKESAQKDKIQTALPFEATLNAKTPQLIYFILKGLCEKLGVLQVRFLMLLAAECVIEKENNFKQSGHKYRSFFTDRQERFITDAERGRIMTELGARKESTQKDKAIEYQVGDVLEILPGQALKQCIH
nr:catalase isozyme 1 [Tanacetum cinerariifolium]